MKQVVRASIKLIGFPKHRAGLFKKKKKSIYGIAKGYPKINVSINFFSQDMKLEEGGLVSCFNAADAPERGTLAPHFK